jgi:hypothetical protein
MERDKKDLIWDLAAFIIVATMATAPFWYHFVPQGAGMMP